MNIVSSTLEKLKLEIASIHREIADLTRRRIYAQQLVDNPTSAMQWIIRPSDINEGWYSKSCGKSTNNLFEAEILEHDSPIVCMNAVQEDYMIYPLFLAAHDELKSTTDQIRRLVCRASDATVRYNNELHHERWFAKNRS